MTIKLGCKRWCCAIAFLLMELWPILVGLVDVARDILEPLLLDIPVVVQIELAVDDLPSFRINRYSVTLAHSERAIAAVLWCVPRRIFSRNRRDEPPWQKATSPRSKCTQISESLSRLGTLLGRWVDDW